MIRRETIHSMIRRRNGWDYCDPGRYMVTLTLADRTRGWLGELAPRARGELAQEIALTALGRIVAEKWREIAANWPGVEVEEFVVMPDHLHGVIRIATRQKHPLGQIIGSFKARSTSAARMLGCKQPSTMVSESPASRPVMVSESPASRPVMVPESPASRPVMVPESLLSGSSLWSPGLTDSILWSAERHRRAVAYIGDNPRRLAEKRANPRLFTLQRDLAVALPIGAGGTSLAAHFAAIGNHGLLDSVEFHQVQCSRRYFAYQTDQWGKPLKDKPPKVETEEFMLASELASMMIKAGAVLVNPCISQGEREIARRAFAAGAKMIVLRNRGFSSLYKPEGTFFDRCTEGRLLMLAPAAWPYTTEQKPMTRDDACVLNRIAQAIARDGAAEIDYKGRTPIFIDEMTRKAVLAVKETK